MKHIFLRRLWREFVAHENAFLDEEEEQVMKAIVTVEEELQRSMTETEQQLLDIYKDHVADLHAVEMENAFVRGVMFSAQYERSIF